MRSILIATLFLTIKICSVSSQVGDAEQQSFFEYLRPFWRLHRARIRPFVFVDPAPLWRVARDTESQSNSVICEYLNSTQTLVCSSEKERHACFTRRQFVDPLLNNFKTFEISEKKALSGEKNNTIVHFTLFPKREINMKITSTELKEKSDGKMLSIHFKEQNSSDEGFSVDNKQCWLKLVDFLGKTAFKKEIKVQKPGIGHKLWTENEFSIGTLNLILTTH